MFVLAILLGLISVFLLFISPLFGIIGLILCALVVIANNNHQKHALESQRHEELVDTMRKK